MHHTIRHRARRLVEAGTTKRKWPTTTRVVFSWSIFSAMFWVSFWVCVDWAGVVVQPHKSLCDQRFVWISSICHIYVRTPTNIFCRSSTIGCHFWYTILVHRAPWCSLAIFERRKNFDNHHGTAPIDRGNTDRQAVHHSWAIVGPIEGISVRDDARMTCDGPVLSMARSCFSLIDTSFPTFVD